METFSLIHFIHYDTTKLKVYLERKSQCQQEKYANKGIILGRYNKTIYLRMNKNYDEI